MVKAEMVALQVNAMIYFQHSHFMVMAKHFLLPIPDAARAFHPLR
jgi:uncharacterized phage-associated protein